jgi:poly(beta-D-mannuronate) lyase
VARWTIESRVRRSRAGAVATAVAGLMGLTPAMACVPSPVPVRDLAAPRFYADATGSEIDPGLARAHAAAIAPLKAFLAQVTSDTDRALSGRSPGAAACPLQWLEHWARGEALLGRMGSKQAEYQRKWDLAGLALAYLKLRPYASPAQRRAIEPWLVRVAGAARAFQLHPDRKRNNHLYWLGLGLAATALATDHGPFWQDARRIMAKAAGAIRADGTLPLELARGQQALHYHAFAVTPLIVMADLAAARGEDWYGLDGGALHRLVARTASGLADVAAFDALAGVPQQRPVRPSAGWLALYVARFPGRLSPPLPDVPARHRWLGGDVRLLPLHAAPAPR